MVINSKKFQQNEQSPLILAEPTDLLLWNSKADFVPVLRSLILLSPLFYICQKK
jgi:hypothetical protein